MKKSHLFTNSIVAFLFQTFTMANVSLAQTNVGVKTTGIDAILQASPVVQFVLLILVSLSVLCWGIAWTKFHEFKKLKEANDIFNHLFWKSNSLDELNEKIDSFIGSSQARVFKSAYIEMKKIAESPMLNKNLNNDSEPPLLSGIDNIERSMRKSAENEMAQLESKLNLLASTGSTGPFIGLFGTVWGIMNSFHKIGETGSASLAAVAPGISEALITTAIGLAAAIPAVIIYNHFISEIKREEISLNNFSSDFLNIIKRNFFKG